MLSALEAELGSLAGEEGTAGVRLKHAGWGGQTGPALLQAVLRAELSSVRHSYLSRNTHFFLPRHLEGGHLAMC